MHTEIEWDPVKAESNLRKHGVRFVDVEAGFYDELALSMPYEFCREEQRFC